nr:tRNA (adenosine(37)-N6)-dimethylallyltransferase MiaA [Microbacterium marinum]
MSRSACRRSASASEAVTAPRLWALVGATGTGKTALSLRLAEAIDAEIVNADAMQLYRGMDIGTAKLPVADRRGIPHHLFDVLEVSQDAAVAAYQRDARQAIREVFDRGKDAVLVGGSGLYVSSVLFDFRFPPRDHSLRAELEAELDREGAAQLLERLRALDPDTAARVDPRNGRRIVRALEVVLQGAATHGATLPDAPESWHPQTTVVGVHVEREALVTRLDDRVTGMWSQGIFAEAEGLLSQGLEQGTTAQRAIGYAQALAQLRGEISEAEAIAQTQALTRRYARRQVSWFKRYPRLHWVAPDATVGQLRDLESPA